MHPFKDANDRMNDIAIIVIHQQKTRMILYDIHSR